MQMKKLAYSVVTTGLVLTLSFTPVFANESTVKASEGKGGDSILTIQNQTLPAYDNGKAVDLKEEDIRKLKMEEANKGSIEPAGLIAPDQIGVERKMYKGEEPVELSDEELMFTTTMAPAEDLNEVTSSDDDGVEVDIRTVQLVKANAEDAKEVSKENSKAKTVLPIAAVGTLLLGFIFGKKMM